MADQRQIKTKTNLLLSASAPDPRMATCHPMMKMLILENGWNPLGNCYTKFRAFITLAGPISVRSHSYTVI